MMQAGILSILAGSGMLSLEPLVDKFKRESKPCLYCDSKHDHNNSFCSKECCAAYKANHNAKKR